VNDGILHESHDRPEPMFRGGKLYSLLDILGGGRVVCDKCQRWQSFSAITPEHAREELTKSGWRFTDGQDICPRCAARR